MPFAYLGRPVIVSVQPLSAFNVTALPLESATTSDSGRMPSWFSLSFQTLRTFTSTVSGVCVLVSVVTVPSVESPVSS